MNARNFFPLIALVCVAVVSVQPHWALAQADSCTYVVFEKSGSCPATATLGTAVCTECIGGSLCRPALDCDNGVCFLRLARVQGYGCAACPIGANPIEGLGFECAEPGAEDTPTPPDGTVGTETPTPSITPDLTMTAGTTSPTATEGTPPATDTPTEGTPAATDTPTGPTVTPTGPTVTPTGPTVTPTGPTVTPTGPTVTPTGPTATATGGTATPTRTGGTVSPTGGTSTPTRTAGTTTPGTPGTPTTRTPTRPSARGDHDDDGCQVVAPQRSPLGWVVLIPAAGLVLWRRRRRS
jgi:hypothetical protein